MYPISRLRVESYVALIRLKELPNGFRVFSSEALSIESFPVDQKNQLRDAVLSLQTSQPEVVSCIAMFELEAIDDVKNWTVINLYGLGLYSD
jgi:hypothetical protein